MRLSVACRRASAELSSGPKFEWEVDAMEGPIIDENDGCKGTVKER